MMKKTLLTALMVLFAVAAFAQKGSVTATLVDADTGDEVIGADADSLGDTRQETVCHVGLQGPHLLPVAQLR